MLVGLYGSMVIQYADRLDLRAWARENGSSEAQASRALERLMRRDLAERPYGGPFGKITSEGLRIAEETGLADPSVAARCGEVRRNLLLALLEARERKGEREGEDWLVVAERLGLERRELLVGLWAMTGWGFVEFGVGRRVRLTQPGMTRALASRDGGAGRA